MRKPRNPYHLVVFLLLVIIPSVSMGQDIYQKYNIYRSPVRLILNKISITGTTGMGFTHYRHDLSGVYFYQDAANQFIFSNDIENLSGNFTGYTNWLNAPEIGIQTNLDNPFAVPFNYLQNPVNNPALQNQTVLIDTDTTDLGFRGVSRGVPITLMLHYEYKDFRIGLGYTYEFHTVRELKPTAFGDRIRNYEPNVRGTRYSRLFGMVGYKFYQFWSYDFVGELQVGRITAGRGLNSGAISRGIYANLGVSIENNWSEYFRVIVRPSIDFKSYTVSIPDGTSIRHGYPTFFLQVGLSINIPEIPRSPMASDHVQLKHVYTDPKTGRKMEVRGQPIWKRQNPKVGENHRTLKFHKKQKRKIKKGSKN